VARDRELFRRPGLGATVRVTEEPSGLRALWAGGKDAVQSLGFPTRPRRLVLPYAKCAIAALAAAPRRRSFLVVGLGGGSLPRFLHATLPGAHVEAIELDPVIAEAARACFGLVPDERLVVRLGDATRLLPRLSRRFDVILLDAFAGDRLPRALLTPSFLAAVRARLAPEGTLLANVWSERLHRDAREVEAAYQQSFPTLRKLVPRHAGNRILVAPPRWPPPPALRANAERLQAELGVRFSLADRLRFAEGPGAAARDGD